jgi:hypothetical protein
MALNDWEGNHVLPNDISLQQFLTEQLRLRLEDKLRENSLKQPVTTKSVEADFRNNRFIFKLDFKKTSASADIDIIPEALKIISWVLRDYAFRDFSEVEISETSTGKNIIVSQKTLFEDFR